MKQLGKLKLNALSQDQLSKQEMKFITGGGDWVCGCGCLYANSGGSSTASNAEANKSSHYFSDTSYTIYDSVDGWVDYGEGIPYGSDADYYP